MNESVYIETSVIGYCTIRSNTDLIVAARQAISQAWWQDYLPEFTGYVSTIVLEEIGCGDSKAAEERLKLVADAPVLEVTDTARKLATRLIAKKHLPDNSFEDALHIATATVHGMDYLVTWNFKHINNATTRDRIVEELGLAGYVCPILCSPEELGG